MDAIPLELVQHILYQVPGDMDPPELSATLRNCSLVSHNWKEIAQPLLFAEFIRYGPYYDQLKLYRTLFLHPYLRDLVRCIWVDIDILSSLLDSDSDTRLAQASDPQSSLDLFDQLISSPRCYHLIIDFRALFLYPKTSRTVSRFSSQTNLTALSITDYVRDPISILYQFPSLEELHLCRSSFTGFDSGDGRLIQDNGPQTEWTINLSRDRPRLSHLYFESADVYDTLKWFLHSDCAFDISKLKTFHYLDMSNEFTSYTLARELVQAVSSSLEDLALDPPTTFSQRDIYTSPEICTFNPLPQLRRLKVSLQQDGLLPWVIHLLSGLVFPDVLEEFELSCPMDDYEVENARKDHHWEELDLLLTSSRSSVHSADSEEAGLAGHRKDFHLKIVRFGIVVTDPTEENITRSRDVAAMLPSLLPKLWGLGIVTTSRSGAFGHVKDSDCWYGS
ncbi:hypothetical protein BDN72DRAFT_963930 [Pluteus cervinus]|uniref:Uncharacterized protein n=1 Tax=Pluteus cervinus TaxID=181527 RepID=A0ACD3ADB5_9AGAR|nr:hypothetical protein BDN72DRAFT_963930 [Pluteus cervinus]